jgi:hypothetical protein
MKFEATARLYALAPGRTILKHTPVNQADANAFQQQANRLSECLVTKP